MRKFLILHASALALIAGAGHAMASDDDDGRSSIPGKNWLTMAQITERYAAEGYEVRQLKIEDGGYEIYALDADGKRVEGHVDPVTGELRADRDD